MYRQIKPCSGWHHLGKVFYYPLPWSVSCTQNFFFNQKKISNRVESWGSGLWLLAAEIFFCSGCGGTRHCADTEVIVELLFFQTRNTCLAPVDVPLLCLNIYPSTCWLQLSAETNPTIFTFLAWSVHINYFTRNSMSNYLLKSYSFHPLK